MMTEQKLELILHKDDDSSFSLYACRGQGKGCSRNKYRASKAKCEDCMGPLPEHWTLQQVIDKLKAGDA